MQQQVSLLEELHKSLSSELLPGEFVVWSGQPSNSVIFHSSDWYALPFSIFWVGFTAFWEYGATGQGQVPHDLSSGFFALWGIPFILIGQYMLWGRFVYVAWRKPRTVYALTNRRVLNLSLGRARKVVDGSLSTLNSVTLIEQGSDTGTLEFSPEPFRETTWGSKRSPKNHMGPDLSRLAFYDIPNSREVYKLIQTEREKIQSHSRENVFRG